MMNGSLEGRGPSRGLSKVVLQVAIGGAVGFVTAAGAMMALRSGMPERPAPDQAFAIGVGVFYVLMSLFVMLGVGLPRIGAKLLNVADEDELRDDRTYLIWSALVCLAFGMALIAAAIAAPGGIVAPPVAVGLFVAAFLLSLVAWRRMRGRQDEFRRLVNAEAAQAGLLLVMTLFGGWAIAAQLGFAAMFTPLTFVAGLLALTIVGAFVTIIQRGLLVR